MHYTISTKECSLTEKTLGHITRHLERINSLLPSLDPDLPLLDIVIRKNKKKRLNHTPVETIDVNHEEEIEITVPKAPSAIFYSGTIKLVLPKKPLIVHMEGENIDRAINTGFERLFKELETYKGKHYVSDSEYFNRDTIRHNSKFEK